MNVPSVTWIEGVPIYILDVYMYIIYITYPYPNPIHLRFCFNSISCLFSIFLSVVCFLFSISCLLSISISCLFSIYIPITPAYHPLKCVTRSDSSVVLLRSVSCISLAPALASLKTSLVNVLGSISLGLAFFRQIGHDPLLCNQPQIQPEQNA